MIRKPIHPPPPPPPMYIRHRKGETILLYADEWGISLQKYVSHATDWPYPSSAPAS